MTTSRLEASSDGLLAIIITSRVPAMEIPAGVGLRFVCVGVH